MAFRMCCDLFMYCLINSLVYALGCILLFPLQLFVLYVVTSVKLDSPEASHSINHGPLLSTREWLVCSTLAGAVVFLGIEGSSVSENSRFTADVSVTLILFFSFSLACLY